MALQIKELSASCMIQGGRVKCTYLLRVTQEKTDPVQNCSQVKVEAVLQQAYNGTTFSNLWTGVSCTIDGENLFSDYRIRTLNGSQEHIYYTWTGQIPHGDDGLREIRISGRLWQMETQGYTALDMQIPETVVVLQPISRASQVEAEDVCIEDRTTVVITPYAEGFTHTLAFTFGEETGYIDQDGNITNQPVYLTGNTVSFLIPEAFYFQIPKKPWGECVLECATYRQEQYRGRSIARFRVKADPVRCGPTVQLELEDVNESTVALTGKASRVVQYMSTLRCRPQIQTRKGATVAVCRINQQPLEADYLDIPNVEDNRITCFVEDSRGYTDRLTISAPMIPYRKLTNNPRAVRTAPTNGRVMLTVSGNCYFGSFGIADNILVLRYRLCPEGGSFGDWQEVQVPITDDHTYRAALELMDVDYTKSYILETEMVDLLDRAAATVTVQPGIPVFHWKKDRFFFHVPVECDDAVSGAYIRSHTLLGQEQLALKLQPGQTVFLFGGAVCGTVSWDGRWQGSGEVTAQAEQGRVTLFFSQSVSDTFLLISPYPLTIE